ncbi:Hypothetical predicted protein [Olea europaea subsp. europaea]|uniref:Uncharacterized protein n=1 Tax=Olea europaea subsp. europaea TaxID=158383 RepID=A0A8S0QA85_OLEEU|nr:Hypothetical predicted protein [Olea europaea subsp. europaea]
MNVKSRKISPQENCQQMKNNGRNSASKLVSPLKGRKSVQSMGGLSDFNANAILA